MSSPVLIAGKYLPVRPLAAGGMAEVELARQIGIDGFEKLVVLKRIRPEYANDRDFVTRFLDEARTVADLRHPNIVQIYDAGCDESGFWLAMAFVHGIAVRRLWKDAEARKQPVPIEHALHVTVGAGRGLHYAHEKADREGRPLGIVHRDVSPQNLLVSFQGEVKVADFGIARADNQQHLTRPGHVWGKLDYMAPEQARGGSVTAASDQFALGIIAWELATGERLFRRENDAETLRAVLTCSVPSISSRVPGFPPSVERVIARALAADATQRYPSCAAFAADLELAASRVPLVLSDGRLGAFLRDLYPEESKELTLRNLPAASGKTRPPPAASSRRNAFLGAGAAVAVLAAGGWWWTSRSPRLLREAEVLAATGRTEEALNAALLVLDANPTDERARALAVQMADEVVERRSTADPKATLPWMRDLIARHPAAADLLRRHALIVEARDLIAKHLFRANSAPVFDFVRRNSDTPEVGLAAARTLRANRIAPQAYLWMYKAALEAHLAPEPVMFDDALEVLQDAAIPGDDLWYQAEYVANKVDTIAFHQWARQTQLNGTGLALLNALESDYPVIESRAYGHLLELRDLTSATRGASEHQTEDFFEAFDAAPPAEQKRMSDAILEYATRDDLPIGVRERVERVAAILEGKARRPRRRD